MNMLRTRETILPAFIKEFDDLFDLLTPNTGITRKADQDFFTEIPLPGLTKDDISIEVKNRTLIIKIEVEDGKGFISRYKNDYYTYYLSDAHDLNKIDAKMSNGLLSLTVPLKKEKKQDSVKVEIK